VASEVRNLAQRSAAREIKDLIQDSVAKVQDGSRLVNESGQHLNDIVAAAKKVANIIEEISAAGQQQASGLDQVNGAIMQMDEMTRQNAAMAEETASVAASMTSQAKALTNLIAVFRIREENARRVNRAPAARPVLAAVRQPMSGAPTRAPMNQAMGAATEWQEF
jgi:methyl-accepting chemotaxis protein